MSRTENEDEDWMDEMIADIGREYEVGSGEQAPPLELLQSNQQMQQGYQAMQYMMKQVIISTSTICQISKFV
jgi:hypothetical protein